MKSVRTRHLSATGFTGLPNEEKEAIYRECEKIPVDEGEPLAPEQRSAWRAARRRMGRPRIGLGAEKVRVSIERGLLREADEFARKHGMSRSQVVAEGLRAVVARDAQCERARSLTR